MDIEALAKTALFKSMTKEEIRLCLEELGSREMEYEKGSMIMRAGDTTDCMGLVLEGSVTIERCDAWGNRSILSHVAASHIFAETYAILPGEVMLVDVQANEDSRVLLINVGGLLSPGASKAWQYKFLRNFLLISAHKNLTLSGRSFHTAPKSARDRVLSYLSSVSLQKHSREFDIPFDRQQMADYLNLERTNMSKELSRMRRDGIIEFRKNHFKLLEPPDANK